MKTIKVSDRTHEILKKYSADLNSIDETITILLEVRGRHDKQLQEIITEVDSKNG